MLKCLSLELRQCKREYGMLIAAILAGFFVIGLGFGYFGFRNRGVGQSVGFEELFIILFVVFTFSIMAVWVIVIVRLFTTYENNMFKINGYLYNTLPVNSWEMILAKVVFVNIWVFVFSVVTVVGLMIFFMATVLVGIMLQPSAISEMVYVLRNIDWIEFGRNWLELLRQIGWMNMVVNFVREVLVSSSLYLCGLFIITFNYTSWMQRLNKVMRVIAGLLLMVVIIFVLSSVSLSFNSLTILITMFGVFSFIGTCWLIDHKVDVNC